MSTLDAPLLPEGRKRCSFWAFGFWMSVWSLIIVWGLIGAYFVLRYGLNQTNMDDYFAFGVWIVVDLAVIALGAGAFFTGFLTYIIGKKELKDIINAAVIIGFICYSGAILMLSVDIGQPIRGWFGFWHANVHSMLTEVMFCITTYLSVLTIEFLPLIFENRKLDEVPFLHHFAHNLHEIMFIFAGVGTFLSFFHQGSLGGMYGVLYARPFAFRTGFLIWPWTFFLFVLSAAATGPCFTMLVVWITQKVSRKKLVPPNVFNLLGKISGSLLAIYMVLKIADTLYWALVTSPKMGVTFWEYYREGPYGFWMVIAELGIGGVLPAIILLIPKARQSEFWLISASILASFGVTMNRFVFVVVSLAIPVLPFEPFASYLPTWQEWAISAAILGYGGIIYSLAYRYLPVFPKEVQLYAQK